MHLKSFHTEKRYFHTNTLYQYYYFIEFAKANYSNLEFDAEDYNSNQETMKHCRKIQISKISKSNIFLIKIPDKYVGWNKRVGRKNLQK